MNFKKTVFLFFLLSGLLCIPAAAQAQSPAGPQAAAASADSWAQEAIVSLYGRGVVPDELMSSFQQPISRAEFTAIMSNVCEYVAGSPVEYAAGSFADISGSAYMVHIQKAFSLGLISGRSDTVFDPDAYIERQEAAKLLFNAVLAVEGQAVPEPGFALRYPDASDISDWALPYVGYAGSFGIMEGKGSGFDPRGALTRQEAMVIMERLVRVRAWGAGSGAPPGGGPAVYGGYDELRALLIGIYDYADDEDDGLRFKHGIDDMEAAMKTVTLGGLGYDISSNYNVTKDEFFNLMTVKLAGADENTVSVFFYTGHGVDLEMRFGNRAEFHRTMSVSDGTKDDYIKYDEFFEAVNKIGGFKILFLCQCYSGEALNHSQDFDGVIITASTADEVSYGFQTGSRTYNEFDTLLSEAIEGAGDANADGLLTLSEIFAYIEDGMVYSTPLSQGLDVYGNFVFSEVSATDFT